MSYHTLFYCLLSRNYTETTFVKDRSLIYPLSAKYNGVKLFIYILKITAGLHCPCVQDKPPVSTLFFLTFSVFFYISSICNNSFLYRESLLTLLSHKIFSFFNWGCAISSLFHVILPFLFPPEFRSFYRYRNLHLRTLSAARWSLSLSPFPPLSLPHTQTHTSYKNISWLST